jgi:hypothetical protein
MRRIPRRAAIAVVLIASVQIGVPAFVLVTAGEGPERFGWQMFAKRGSLPTVRVVDGQGHDKAVDLPRLARPRPELDYSSVLPSYVCDRHPRARAVVVTQKVPQRQETTQC